MTTVNTTAETLQEGIKNMMNGAKEDYAKWSGKGTDMSAYTKEQLDKWDDSITIKEGQKYIKVIRENGVFCFIVKKTLNILKGDILKAAGFNAPALNQPRGNVLKGNYPIQWTGPLLLKIGDYIMKDTQLKKDIIKLALAESATDCNIVCGTLFAKFDVSIHEQMATNLKKTLQTFFDKRKVNDCNVQMSGTLPDNEYAYDFVPVVDYRLDGIGI